MTPMFPLLYQCELAVLCAVEETLEPLSRTGLASSLDVSVLRKMEEQGLIVERDGEITTTPFGATMHSLYRTDRDVYDALSGDAAEL